MNGSAKANGTNGHNNGPFPKADSSLLILTHPTIEEKRITWAKNHVMWGGALSVEDYLKREESLMTASSLTRDGGISHWILVEKDSEPNNRPIYASSESIRKRAYVRPAGSNEIKEAICHGIGGVFSYEEYRGHGYASRMMRDLGETLKTYQGTEAVPVAFSALWSDIGKQFYAKHGWLAFPSTHVEFQPAPSPESLDVKRLSGNDLPKLAKDDEAMIKASMLKANDGKTHVTVAPDMPHLEWHRVRETFLTRILFGRIPETRGALVGQPGSRIWVVWTRAYYGKPDDPKAGNALYILRLIIEDEEQPETEERLQRRAEGFKAVIQAAQNECIEWKLRHVELWNPSPLVQKLIDNVGIEHTPVERATSSIPSIMWHGPGSGKPEGLEWVKNEKFCWC